MSKGDKRMARQFTTKAQDFETAFADFLAEPRADDVNIGQTVSHILRDVETRAGDAVAEYTARFDRLQIDPVSLTAPSIDLDALAHSCPADLRAAIDFAHDRIADYARRQLPEDMYWQDSLGAELGWRWTPIDNVGVYVPGGRASYPSSVLMNIVPAKIAQVKRIVMVAPAPEGRLSSAVAYAAQKAGIDAYYPIGGAQAVGALAYGCGALRPVDKIVGPGNAYVAEAKRQVFGKVGIDTIAGPSEILIIADDSANAEWIAADLLSQAEHDPSSQSILISLSSTLAETVAAAVSRQLDVLQTEPCARQSWQNHGAIIIAQSCQEAADLANRIAPEHLQICLDDETKILPLIRHAGAIFLGAYAPEVLGDYVTGSNHVLPTSRAARFSSGLGVYDFLKRISIQKLDAASFRELAGAAKRLGEAENLPAHVKSVTIRL